ncbi:MAG: PAC2 family protein [Chloroflexi bacterium]|nr:MAG: PAC2 family protein [Chloroflexota bacterium]
MALEKSVDLWEVPEIKDSVMFIGWRQWADAGSISSGLPRYLAKLTDARKIGEIRPEGFYLFQFPGTHDLVRPLVKFKEGFPELLQINSNEIYYAEQDGRGLVFFIGDEPHMDAERYVASMLSIAEALNVKRMVGFGGVYGELPYDKERFIFSIYSLKSLKIELDNLGVNLSDYQGGASIGSYLCKRAGELEREYVSFFAFVPTYDFSNLAQVGSSIRIENDYTAWLGVMRRVVFMLQLQLDLGDLEKKSERLIERLDAKVDELDGSSPQVGVREYMQRLSEEFTEVTFDPLDDIWEQELRRLEDKFEDE